MSYYKHIRFDNSPDSERLLFKEALTDIYSPTALAPNLYGIEIGVLNGETSAFLLSLCDTLIGIDPIEPDSMDSSLIGSTEKIHNNTKRFGARFMFINDYSFNVAAGILDNSNDFVFIDGDHTYEAVKLDYKLYFPKVKIGGLIFIHDSRMNRGGANFHVGPSRFVDELIINDNRVEIIGETFSLTCFKKI